ncbi:MAG: hypothetical protein WCO54_05655 [Bacteroidota bacterium]
MATKNTKNKIEKAFQSLDGIERSPANPFLYGKVLNRIQTLKADTIYTGKAVFRFALAAAVIVVLNVAGIYKRESERIPRHKATIEEFATEYNINQDIFNY